MTTKNVTAIVLAAGKGTRMKSDIPKVMHKVAGKTMIARVTDSLKNAGVENVCVVISEDEKAFTSFTAAYPEVTLCVQKERKGTADAVGSAAKSIKGVTTPRYSESHVIRGEIFESEHLLVCTGDTPAMEADVLEGFISHCLSEDADVAVLGMKVPEPFGYGRIVMDSDGRIDRIVEEKDANEEIKKIDVCNSGVFFGRARTFFDNLDQVDTQNTQAEYYLTDVVKIGKSRGQNVVGYTTDRWQGFLGVNDQTQKADVEKIILDRG